MAWRLAQRNAGYYFCHPKPPVWAFQRGGRVVECDGFEIRYTCKGIGGSNPPLSTAGFFFRGKKLVFYPNASRARELAEWSIAAVLKTVEG